MAVVWSKIDEYGRDSQEDEDGRFSMTVHYKVLVDNNNYDGPQVIREAAFASPNPIPQRGDTYDVLGSNDTGAFCRTRNASLVDDEDPTLWRIRCRFEPLRSGENPDHLQNPNPLDWTHSIHITWVEDQELIDEATCLTDLEGAERGPSYPASPGTPGANDPGPLVNAANVQTIDPIFDTIYRPVLNIRKMYASEQAIIDLNDTYERTTNNGIYYGAPARFWRYQLTKSEGIKRKHVEGLGLIEYVPGVTVLEGNKKLWTRKILNNGFAAMKKSGGSYQVDTDNKRKLFDIQVENDDGEKERTSEPLNLNADGTFTPQIQANNIEYLNLTETDYLALGLGGSS